MLDFATRVHNHNYRLDPIIRSLLDTDFYKFLMHQFIWMLYPDVPVTFSLINRTQKVRLAELIPEASLRAQLDYVRDLQFQENELIWLAGNRFYGRRDIFRPEYIEYLRGFRLPDYRLDRRHLVGDLRARGRQRAALARGHGFARQVRVGRALRPGQDQVVGQDPAPARLPGDPPGRVRHAAAPRLPVAGMGDDRARRRAGAVLRRHLERAPRLQAQHGGDRHQFARAADGGRLSRPRRCRAQGVAIYGAGQMAGGVRRRAPHHAAGHLRHDPIPTRRAGLGGGLDRHAVRQQGAVRGRRGDGRLVSAARTGPTQEARHVQRWARRGFDDRALFEVPRAHARKLRLGHARDQRLPRLPSARSRYARSRQPGLQGHASERAERGEAVRQSREGDRQPGGDRALSARVWQGGAGGAAGPGVRYYSIQ